MITPDDKKKVEQRLDVFDQLLEEDEYIQQQRALGREEGEILATRGFLIYVTDRRFPSLVELAQQKAERTTQLSTLNEIIRLIDNAPDASTARYILSS
jgi:hypothetical protein